MSADAVAAAKSTSSRPGALSPAGRELTVTTWNLGYAGLGAGSDFVVDGGTHWFPPSRAAARENAAAIAAWLAAHPTDVVLTQELARAGPPNRWVDLKRQVDQALAETESVFFADLTSRLAVWPLAVCHGLGVYARHPIGSHERVPLPGDGDIPSGMMVKRYAASLVRLPTAAGPPWTIIDFHLAAFDEGAKLRRRQLAEVFELAQREYAAGACVVIGGDWNMRLAPTEFPNTTEARHIEWLATLDPADTPDGWRIVADPATASVRTNYQPYVAGQNYTAVIDGFAISPNVEAVSVTCADLGFRNADHQPVTASFKQRVG
jgi:endonuclease/exonuclease/phosphatase family metal-dependent hydrolase